MIEWDWVAAAAIFGLVVCAVVGFWAPRKVSIAERIGGHTVTVPHGRTISDSEAFFQVAADTGALINKVAFKRPGDSEWWVEETYSDLLTPRPTDAP